MFPLYLITLRQLTGRWRLIVLITLAVVPVLLGLVVKLNDSEIDTDALDELFIRTLFGVAVVPVSLLTIASAALGNELEDRTLSNLTLSPLPRWQIILPKLFATVTVGAPPVLISAIATTAIVYNGDASAIVATAVGIALMVVAYSTLFLLLGLVTNHALGFGLFYVFLWEFLLTGYISGIRFLSIRAYMVGIVKGLDDMRFPDEAKIVISLPVSLIVLVVVSVIFTYLAIERLRRMDVP
jgi:ABC-2 type transport system permease protein